MKFSPGRYFTAFCFLLTCNALAAKTSAYHRAQTLAEDDPREAEALFVQFIKDSGNDKLKRAAAHELFTLRLKQGRIAEAFFQASSSTFRKRFLSAVEENLKVSEALARRLVTVLRRECEGDGDVGVVGELLDKQSFPVAAYNFSLAVLERCKVEDPVALIPDLPEDSEKITARALQLAMLGIREAISRDEFERAEELIGDIRSEGKAILEKEAALVLQLDFTEARLFSKKEDFAAVKNRCAAIEKKKPPRWLRNACRFLTAFVYLKEEKYSEAYAKVANLKVTATEIDNRLLRLTAAVAADEEEAEKLAKFMKRRSYKECAPVLRKLAAEILEIKAQNR